MVIHIGQKIKEELYAKGISVSVFAKKISRSRNVVYKIFERESIDTELLNKMAQILNCDFFSLFSSQKELSHKHVKHYSETLEGHNCQCEELVMLHKKCETLRREVEYLKKIIALLESDKSKSN